MELLFLLLRNVTFVCQGWPCAQRPPPWRDSRVPEDAVLPSPELPVSRFPESFTASALSSDN